MKRWRVKCEILVEHERGPEPSRIEVSKAVADRLGDGAIHVHVDGRDGSFAGSRVVPVETSARLAVRA